MNPQVRHAQRACEAAKARQSAMTAADKARRMHARGVDVPTIATKLGMRPSTVRLHLSRRAGAGRPAKGRVQLRCTVEPATLEWLQCFPDVGVAIDWLVAQSRADAARAIELLDQREVPSEGGT
jgi:hypothetical protein